MANLTKQPLLTFLQWGAIVQSERRTNRHPAYHFYAGSDSQIHLFKFEFDVHTMQYSCKASTMAMPHPNPNPDPKPKPNPKQSGEEFVIAAREAEALGATLLLGEQVRTYEQVSTSGRKEGSSK